MQEIDELMKDAHQTVKEFMNSQQDDIISPGEKIQEVQKEVGNFYNK